MPTDRQLTMTPASTDDPALVAAVQDPANPFMAIMPNIGTPLCNNFANKLINMDSYLNPAFRTLRSQLIQNLRSPQCSTADINSMIHTHNETAYGIIAGKIALEPEGHDLWVPLIYELAQKGVYADPNDIDILTDIPESNWYDLTDVIVAMQTAPPLP